MEKNDALAALTGLGQDLRLSVMRELIAAGDSGLVAGALAEKLDILPNTLSAALAKLEAAALVSAGREGRFIRYRARLDTMEALVTFLMADCCGGDPARCGVAVSNLMSKEDAA